MTNGDRIRQMTDEELAEFLCDRVSCSDCDALGLCINGKGHANGLVKWLKQEVEDDRT